MNYSHLLVYVIIFISLGNAFVVWKAIQKKHAIPPTTVQVVDSPVTPFNPEPEVEPAKKRAPEYVSVPTYRANSENSVLGDILSHCKDGIFGNAHGRSTNAHETTHEINSELRNEYHSKMQKKVNAFYCLEGNGVIIEEPNMRKSAVAAFVPQSLKFTRYSLYITGQTAWDDTPLYICDEWQAYLNGASCAVDDVKNGRHRGGWGDDVCGCLEFSIYATALAMAVEKNDPGYWERNEQFKNYVYLTLQKSYAVYIIGSQMQEFRWDKQDALWEKLKTSPDASAMRDFLKKHFDGIWLD